MVNHTVGKALDQFGIEHSSSRAGNNVRSGAYRAIAATTSNVRNGCAAHCRKLNVAKTIAPRQSRRTSAVASATSGTRSTLIAISARVQTAAATGEPMIALARRSQSATLNRPVA